MTNKVPTTLSPVVKEAQERFDLCNSREAYARQRYDDDYRFANADSDNGYQWNNEDRNARAGDRRPTLTINKTRQHNLNIINEAKQNKAAIKYMPTGNGATFEAAQIWMALARRIEAYSDASEVYSTGTEHMVQGGFGYARMKTEYVSETSFLQQLRLVRIPNPLLVFIDPDAQERDKSDMRFAFIYHDMDRKEFDREYPKLSELASLGPAVRPGSWINDQFVRTAEYFRIESVDDVLWQVVSDDDGVPPLIAFQSETPKELVDEWKADKLHTRSRKVERKVVRWSYIVGDHEVETNVWPGKYIPIISFIAEEVVIDNKIDRKSHTRALKDPQRMYNWWSPLALNTPLPTPSGWTTMGSVQAGDWLFDEKGQPCQVVGTSPVHVQRKCYRVTFGDGTFIDADAEHLWTVEEKGKRKMATWDWQKKTITTEELTPKKHFIWMTDSLGLPEKDLPLHPYLLGVWLGDGTSAEPQITSGFADMQEMRYNLLELGYVVGDLRVYGDKTAAAMTVHNTRHIFSSLGLLGNKHIPAQYLRASHEQREQLLQGLMDTDGNIDNNVCYFTTADDRLALDFSELLRSLGIKAKFVMRKAQSRLFPSGEIYETKGAYQFSFTALPSMSIFKLARKRKLQKKDRPIHLRRTKRHEIKSIIEIPSVPTKCVALNTESHLFLAGEGMIPTHNSAAVEYGALQTKTPWIAAAEAIDGRENDWNNANRQNKSVLIYNAFNEEGETIQPPQRIEPPVSAPVAIQGMEIASREMAMVSGQYESQMGAPSNERSGKAINERQRMGDRSTYHYTDAQAIAIKFVGKIILDTLPRIYEPGQVVQILAEDGQSLNVKIDPGLAQAFQAEQNEDGEVVQRILNPTIGQYDVIADVGPGYATRREETFNALVLLLTQAPQLATVIGDLLFRSGDFMFADEAAERLRRMVPPQALGQGPTQNEQMLMQQLQQMQEMMKKLAEENAGAKIKLRGRDEKRDIEVYKAFTERLGVLQKAGLDAHDQALATVQLMHDMMNDSLEATQTSVDTNLQSGTAQATGQMQLPLQGGGGPAPVQGARLAPDGHHYVPDPVRPGKFMRVVAPGMNPNEG